MTKRFLTVWVVVVVLAASVESARAVDPCANNACCVNPATCVVTDRQTLQGLTIDSIVPCAPYQLGAYCEGGDGSTGIAPSPSGSCGLSFDSTVESSAAALNGLDHHWLQSLTTPKVVDFGAPVNTAIVFVAVDHGPFPEEGIEATVWGTNSCDTDDGCNCDLSSFPTGWTLGTLTTIWKRGWEDPAACQGQDNADDYVGQYSFPGGGFRFVAVHANFSISIFDDPNHASWDTSDDNDTTVPGWQSADDEIDAVGTPVCEPGEVTANAGPDSVGIVGKSDACFDGTGSIAVNNFANKGWDLDGNGSIDTSGFLACVTCDEFKSGTVTLFVTDTCGCVDSDTANYECVFDGACCLGDCGCEVLTEANCAAAGGVYQGNQTQCPFDTGAELMCPDPITLDRGDKLCNDDVQNWLDSAFIFANGLCPAVITNDAPECGFPSGSTTTVTWNATECGFPLSCKSTITINPAPRGSGDQKGSLLAFSKIEIKWDADGKLIQDTLLDVSNDADLDGVEIQAYFVNGDRQIDEQSDMQGNVIQEFEPGWNTADCRFHLTKNQPHFWSAAKGSNKCQPFTVLDADGRLDSEATDGTRLLRGFVIMWAVRFHDPVLHNEIHTFGENGFWEEIRWNHLKGDAVIVNYRLGSAWEYNAWAYQARCGETGEPPLDCLAADGAGTCCSAGPVPGKLRLDGFQYDINFDELLLDFYASGSTGLSTTGVGVMVDTDLTLHSMDIDVRQDGDGPILTKAEFEIFNENESKFSGTRRCICCWDQTLLSNYVRTVAVPNHFLRSKLGTNKGYARIDGVHSDECDYYETCGIEPRETSGLTAGIQNGHNPSRDTALAGLSFKILTFTGASSNIEWAGGNLHGSGEQSSTIRVDVEQGSGEAQGAP